MSKYSSIPLLLVIALLASLAWHDTSFASSGLKGPSQTIPTRTPTPGAVSPPPTVVIPPTSPPGGGPTSSPIPGTPTASPTGPTPTETATFVSADSLTPTAAACSDRPTVQALDITNVRAGPGPDYPVVTTLFYLQVNLIVGRAAESPWWLIGLDGGGSGWVADEVVLVRGYTGSVPIADAPPIENMTVTPGTPWNPTPNPSCTVTPTHTPSPSATATATANPTTSPRASVTLTPEPASQLAVASAGETATAESAATETRQSHSTPSPQSAVTEAAATLEANGESSGSPPTDVRETATPEPTPVPLPDDRPSRALDLLPVAGLILLGAGIIISIARRTQHGGS